MVTLNTTRPAPLGNQGSGSGQPPKVVKSHALLMGEREIYIAHGNDIYRLSVTRQGKLILTK
jgi:hemin uptake protein HemP